MLIDHDAETARNGQQARRVTIMDVAEALGLAKGTVSRALNDYPDISEATRLRVRRTAERMGYSPLVHAQAIRTGRTRALGLVLEVSQHDAQRPFLADFLAGISLAASAEDWSLTVATATTPEGVLDTMRRLVAERKADGFILPRTRAEDPRIDYLRAAGVPFVLWGRTQNARDCAWFDILGERAMEDAVARLAGFGHRHIAYVGGGIGYNYSLLRLQGFVAAIRKAGLDLPEGYTARAGVTLEDGEAAGHALLTGPVPPTGIVCATDMGALGVYRAAQKLRLAVGRDVSVIAYDGIPEGRHAAPPLTTFEVDSRRAGERLASLLIRRIRGEAAEDLRETACATLRSGGSDGPPTLTPEDLRAQLVRNRQKVRKPWEDDT